MAFLKSVLPHERVYLNKVALEQKHAAEEDPTSINAKRKTAIAFATLSKIIAGSDWLENFDLVIPNEAIQIALCGVVGDAGSDKGKGKKKKKKVEKIICQYKKQI